MGSQGWGPSPRVNQPPARGPQPRGRVPTQGSPSPQPPPLGWAPPLVWDPNSGPGPLPWPGRLGWGPGPGVGSRPRRGVPTQGSQPITSPVYPIYQGYPTYVAYPTYAAYPFYPILTTPYVMFESKKKSNSFCSSEGRNTLNPKKSSYSAKKVRLGFRGFRTCFWEVDHTLCDV